MTAAKGALVVVSGAVGTALTAVQGIAVESLAALITALVGATTVGGILLYLVRRVNAIPAEEALRRHDAVDRIFKVMSENYGHHDEALNRMEARITAAITTASAQAAAERHRLDDRIRALERELPRPGGR